MSQPKRRATYEDLMQVPDHLVAEIIDGELVTSPRPASPHAWTSTVLGQDLGSLNGRGGAGRPGGWWILVEPEAARCRGRTGSRSRCVAPRAHADDSGRRLLHARARLGVRGDLAQHRPHRPLAEDGDLRP
jgi:hypothetical protein